MRHVRTLLAAVAAALVVAVDAAVPGAGRRHLGRAEHGVDHDQGSRLRPRPRHVAVRRRGCRPGGARRSARSRSSTTPAPPGARPRAGSGCRSPPTPPRPRRPDAVRPDPARRRHGPEHRAPRQRREPLADRGQPRRAGPGRLLHRPLASYRCLDGEGAFAAGGAPVTLVTPSGNRRYRGRLGSAPTAGNTATLNMLTLEAYLRGVVPKEMPAPGARRRSRPRRSRPAPTRRTSGHTDDAALRHHLLPGVRRLRRRAPGLQRGHRRHPRARPDVRRRAGVHPVRLQQRGLDLRGLRAVPRRQGGPLRRLVRKPGPHLVASGPGRRPRARLAERSATCSGSSSERDGNGQWGGGHLDPDRGQRGPGHGQRRHAAQRPGLRSTWVNFKVKPRTS